jgi:hypothetical protein
VSLFVLNGSECVPHHLAQHKRCEGKQFEKVKGQKLIPVGLVRLEVPGDDAEGVHEEADVNASLGGVDQVVNYLH